MDIQEGMFNFKCKMIKSNKNLIFIVGAISDPSNNLPGVLRLHDEAENKCQETTQKSRPELNGGKFLFLWCNYYKRFNDLTLMHNIIIVNLLVY